MHFYAISMINNLLDMLSSISMQNTYHCDMKKIDILVLLRQLFVLAVPFYFICKLEAISDRIHDLTGFTRQKTVET